MFGCLDVLLCVLCVEEQDQDVRPWENGQLILEIILILG
jgi:hypothetical protein